MVAVTVFSDFGTQENKVCHCFHCFPIYLPWSDGTRCNDLRFWMLSFKSAFSLFSFTFKNRLFSSPSLSTKRVVVYAYLRLLIFLPDILITVCASSSLAFHMMCNACKLNIQCHNIHPLCNSFTIWTNPLFHVWFKVLLLDLHTGFSGGRYCCLIFPSF